MESFNFRCGNGSVDSAICGGRGRCENNICVCPVGFEADNIFFHFPNCALPSPFLEVFIIEYTILCFPVLVALLYYGMKLPTNGKVLTAFTFGSLFTTWVGALALFLEHGSFEAASFMYGLFCAFDCFMCAKLLLHVLEPLFDSRGADKRFLKRSLWLTSFILAGSLVICGCIMAAVSRTDSNLYNKIGYAFFLLFLVGGCSYTGLLHYHSSRLLNQLTTLIRASRVPTATKLGFTALTERLIIFKRGALVLFSVIFFWYSAAIVIPIEGSMPYFYIFNLLSFHSMLCLCIGVLALIRPKRLVKKGSSIILDAVSSTNA
jgi:hypothetical protein